MKVEINDLASLGVIRDVEAYMLPPEAFSFGENVRFYDKGAERLTGRTQVFGTPTVAPHFALPVSSPSQTYWMYTSLTKAYVYDGVSHTNITRAAGDYTGTETREWNGTLFGGVPILNNGVDAPQFWSALNPATPLAALTNFPASTTARVMRAYGPYLLALDVTKSTGTRYPHMVKWSHPADPGSIPVSWDNTDPTRDAGEKDLQDVNAGIILDGLPLGGNFFVYKEGSMWRMTHIGGQFIFDFKPFLETAGILAPRCVTISADGLRHFVATQDDIIMHNGSSAQSVLEEKYKKHLVNVIDISNFMNCFMFTNPFKDEVWFCFPESGSTQPNRALIIPKRGAISEAEVNFRNAAIGIIESASADTWASVTGTWATYVGPWSQSNRRKVVLCGTASTKFWELDSGITNDGTAFVATLQRVGLSVEGRKRNGDWIVSYDSDKLVVRTWIKASGGPINIRIGSQEVVDGAVSWSATTAFDPTAEKYVDIVVSGKAIAIEFSAAVPFRIMGYKVEGEIVGEF